MDSKDPLDEALRQQDAFLNSPDGLVPGGFNQMNGATLGLELGRSFPATGALFGPKHASDAARGHGTFLASGSSSSASSSSSSSGYGTGFSNLRRNSHPLPPGVNYNFFMV